SIITTIWHWSQFARKAIVVTDASTNGCHARAQRTNQKFVQAAKVHIGIDRESITSNRGHSVLSKSLTAETGRESGIRTHGSLLRPEDSLRSLVLQTSALNRSAISPLKRRVGSTCPNVW